MLGNCATGRVAIVTAPTITIRIAITIATMGRLIKNLDIIRFLCVRASQRSLDVALKMAWFAPSLPAGNSAGLRRQRDSPGFKPTLDHQYRDPAFWRASIVACASPAVPLPGATLLPRCLDVFARRTVGLQVPPAPGL